MTKPIRVPWIFDSSFSQCISPNIILPSERCRFYDPDLESLFLLLRILLHQQTAQIELVPVDGFSKQPNRTSIVGSVESGEVDLSPGYLIVSYERNKLIRFIRPLQFPAAALTYRRPRHRLIIVDFRKLFPEILLLSGLLLALGFALLKCAQRKFGMDFACTFGIVCFCAEIQFSVFAGYVTEIFTDDLQTIWPFGKRGDLMRQANEGNFVILVNSKSFWTFLPGVRKDRVRVLDKLSDIADLIENEPNGVKFVGFGKKTDLDFQGPENEPDSLKTTLIFSGIPFEMHDLVGSYSTNFIKTFDYSINLDFFSAAISDSFAVRSCYRNSTLIFRDPFQKSGSPRRRLPFSKSSFSDYKNGTIIEGESRNENLELR